jgi:hypothetical protein
MSDRNWFQKKWGLPEVTADVLFKKIEELEQRIVKLEEENVETTNVLYEIMENIRAVDARIDIIFEEIEQLNIVFNHTKKQFIIINNNDYYYSDNINDIIEFIEILNESFNNFINENDKIEMYRISDYIDDYEQFDFELFPFHLLEEYTRYE